MTLGMVVGTGEVVGTGKVLEGIWTARRAAICSCARRTAAAERGARSGSKDARRAAGLANPSLVQPPSPAPSQGRARDTSQDQTRPADRVRGAGQGGSPCLSVRLKSTRNKERAAVLRRTALTITSIVFNCLDFFSLLM